MGSYTDQRMQRQVNTLTCQSVSSTTAVCPRNNGILSGTLPRSSTGMTANAPPPLDSQFTDMYSGLAYMLSGRRIDVEEVALYLHQV